MLTVAILKNENPLMARSAVRVSTGVYRCDDGTIIEHNYDDGAIALAVKLLGTIKEKPMNTDINYPAIYMVHWPSGPVACCASHADGLIKLGNFMGSHVVKSPLLSPAECMNCVNEAKGKS